MKKRVKRVNLMKSISKVVVVLVFLTAMLAIEMQVVAQERGVIDMSERGVRTIDFSNPIMTTDCCLGRKGKIEEIINNAPVVVEGRLIKEERGKKGIHSEKRDSLEYGRLLYRTYLFEIEKVYRGGERLEAGTIEIIVRVPVVGPHKAISLPNGWYILFAKEIDVLGAFDINNTIKLELYNDEYSFPSYFEGCTPYYHPGFSLLDFRTKDDVRDFLAVYGLTPTDMPKADTVKTLSREDIEEAKEKAIRDAEYKKNLTPYKTKEESDSIRQEINRKRGFDLDTIPRKNTDKSQKSGSRGSVGDFDLIINIDSIKLTQNGNDHFVEFDVVGRADRITDTSGRYLEFDIVLIFNHNVTQRIITKHTELNL